MHIGFHQVEVPQPYPACVLSQGWHSGECHAELFCGMKVLDMDVVRSERTVCCTHLQAPRISHNPFGCGKLLVLSKYGSVLGALKRTQRNGLHGASHGTALRIDIEGSVWFRRNDSAGRVWQIVACIVI